MHEIQHRTQYPMVKILDDTHSHDDTCHSLYQTFTILIKIWSIIPANNWKLHAGVHILRNT